MDVLFEAFGSDVVVDTFATFAMVLPLAAEAAAAITNEKVAGPLGDSDPIVQVIVPVPPAGGVEQVNMGPAVWDAETNVIPAGTASVSETVVALDGPLFVTVLFEGFVSKLSVVIVAVFVIDVVLPVLMVRLNCAEAPFARDRNEQLTVPLEPGGGVKQVAAGPAFCVSDTNCVPAGSGSVIRTLAAASGPALATVTV